MALPSRLVCLVNFLSIKIQASDLAIPLLGIWGYTQKELKVETLRVIGTPIFIAALFTTTKMWKQPKCPSADAYIKKWGANIKWIIM